MVNSTTDIAMLVVCLLVIAILLIFFVFCKKKTYDGKIEVFIDEDRDYKASMTFYDLMNAANKGEGYFSVETIYVESGD